MIGTLTNADLGHMLAIAFGHDSKELAEAVIRTVPTVYLNSEEYVTQEKINEHYKHLKVTVHFKHFLYNCQNIPLKCRPI